MKSNKNKLILDLFKFECIKFGEFTLKSGIKSPIYTDMRNLISSPTLLQRVSYGMASLVHSYENYNRLACIPLGGMPLGVSLSMNLYKPLIYTRTDKKEHGIDSQIIGKYNKGDRVILIDDVISSGESKKESISILNKADLAVDYILVAVDRRTNSSVRNTNFQVKSLLNLKHIVECLHTRQKISEETKQEVLGFLND